MSCLSICRPLFNQYIDTHFISSRQTPAAILAVLQWRPPSPLWPIIRPSANRKQSSFCLSSISISFDVSPAHFGPFFMARGCLVFATPSPPLPCESIQFDSIDSFVSALRTLTHFQGSVMPVPQGLTFPLNYCWRGRSS